jgi:hypothetical protein
MSAVMRRCGLPCWFTLAPRSISSRAISSLPTWAVEARGGGGVKWWERLGAPRRDKTCRRGRGTNARPQPQAPRRAAGRRTSAAVARGVNPCSSSCSFKLSSCCSSVRTHDSRPSRTARWTAPQPLSHSLRSPGRWREGMSTGRGARGWTGPAGGGPPARRQTSLRICRRSHPLPTHTRARPPHLRGLAPLPSSHLIMLGLLDSIAASSAVRPPLQAMSMSAPRSSSSSHASCAWWPERAAAMWLRRVGGWGSKVRREAPSATFCLHRAAVPAYNRQPRTPPAPGPAARRTVGCGRRAPSRRPAWRRGPAAPPSSAGPGSWWPRGSVPARSRRARRRPSPRLQRGRAGAVHSDKGGRRSSFLLPAPPPSAQPFPAAIQASPPPNAVPSSSLMVAW